MIFRPFESRASEASLNTSAEQRAVNRKNITDSTKEHATFKETNLPRLKTLIYEKFSRAFLGLRRGLDGELRKTTPTLPLILIMQSNHHK
jgi:hypothetical protein